MLCLFTWKFWDIMNDVSSAQYLEPVEFGSCSRVRILPPVQLSSTHLRRNFLPSYAAIVNISHAVNAPIKSTSETCFPPMPHPSLFVRNRATTAMKKQHTKVMLTSDTSPYSFLGQARGPDGRFLAKGVLPCDIDERPARKVCGWCGTLKTTQWRIGPTSGSASMLLFLFIIMRYAYSNSVLYYFWCFIQKWVYYATPVESIIVALSPRRILISI